jgi:hypothetical protein
VAVESNLKDGRGIDIAVVNVIRRFSGKSVVNLNKLPSRQVHLVGNDNAQLPDTSSGTATSQISTAVFDEEWMRRRRISVLNDNDKPFRGATVLKFRPASTAQDQRFLDAAKPLAVRPTGRREIYPRHLAGAGRMATCECRRARR